MKQNQVKWGAILSYFLIIFNTLYGLFITPYILGCLGEAEYGVYKTIGSLASSLVVLDLGMGATVMRYVAKFKANKEDDKIPNFIAMNLVQAVILCAVIGVVAVGVFQTIHLVYGATFTIEQIEKAQLLFIILIANMMVHVFSNVINGTITGYNCFLFGNGIKVVRLLVRTGLIILLLNIFKDSVVLVLIESVCSIIFLLIELWYVYKKLNVKIRLSKWEQTLFVESGKYTILMFLTSIAAQVNNNLDNVIIGAIDGPTFVTVYSFGLLIFGMFEQLSTSISSVMLPTVTNLLVEQDGMKKVENLVVRAGRIQFMLLGSAFVGFFCLGKDFIQLWLGEGFDDVYIITLILMLPALFELCVNVCLSILRAKNMLTFRTVTLFASTVLNAIITVIAVKYWSYIGAAFGTAASFIIGSLIVMNIYYYKKLGLNMLRIYRRIFNGTWVCLLVAGVGLFVFQHFLHGGIMEFLGGVLVYVILFVAGLLLFGFNQEEKRRLKIGGKTK